MPNINSTGKIQDDINSVVKKTASKNFPGRNKEL